MNQLIKQITGQVLDELVPETWTSLGYDKIKEIQYRTAELIVRECIKLCEYESNNDIYDQYDMGMQVKAEDIKALIKEHFGVAL
jgi:hypothetical protein